MSVYTRVTEDDLRRLLADYSIGELEDFRGITAGITNTNYFVDTSTGRWVLTLFEQMDNGSLPFFMQLMDHLAHSKRTLHLVYKIKHHLKMNLLAILLHHNHKNKDG